MCTRKEQQKDPLILAKGSWLYHVLNREDQALSVMGRYRPKHLNKGGVSMKTM